MFITLLLVAVEKGQDDDRFNLRDDYVLLDSHYDAQMRRQIVSVMSIRFQSIQILLVYEGSPSITALAVVSFYFHLNDELTIANA